MARGLSRLRALNTVKFPASLLTFERKARNGSMTEKMIATLARMDVRGTLEVEHLLRTARKASPSLADALDELAIARGWPLAPCFPKVPMGTWVRVVGIYCREGHVGLLAAASNPDMLSFVLGLLQDLRTDEALSTLIRLARAYRERLLANPEQAIKVAGALNIAAMRTPQRKPCEAERVDGRDFLHDAFHRVTADHHQGIVLCALRFFGDETSLSLISSCQSLSPHWESARRAAVRSIKNGMKQGPASS